MSVVYVYSDHVCCPCNPCYWPSLPNISFLVSNTVPLKYLFWQAWCKLYCVDSIIISQFNAKSTSKRNWKLELTCFSVRLVFLPYAHGLTRVQTGVYIICLSSAKYLFLRQRIKKNILVSLSKYAGTTQRVTGYSTKKCERLKTMALWQWRGLKPHGW